MLIDRDWVESKAEEAQLMFRTSFRRIPRLSTPLRRLQGPPLGFRQRDLTTSQVSFSLAMQRRSLQQISQVFSVEETSPIWLESSMETQTTKY
jgi:hypothetical protein